MGTDYLKTTAFELSNESLEYLLPGRRHEIVVQGIGRLTHAGLRAAAWDRILYRRRAEDTQQCQDPQRDVNGQVSVPRGGPTRPTVKP